MAVSPSLLAGVKPVPEDWIPPRELLLGLGEPWEPFPWDSCYDTEDVNVDLLVASQQYEAVLQNSIDEENVDSFLLAASQDYEKSTEVSSRWAPPTDSSEICVLRKSGVPQKKTKPTGHFECGVIGPCTDKGILSKLKRHYTHFKTILLKWTEQTWLSGYANLSRKHVDGTKNRIHPIRSTPCAVPLKESDCANVKPFFLVCCVCRFFCCFFFFFFGLLCM